MTLKTHNIIHILLASFTIGCSFVLFLVSLFFPVFNLSNSDSIDGFTALLMGWAGFLLLGNNIGAEIGFLGWYANLFFFPIWLGLAFSIKFRVAAFIGFVITLIGIGLAACSVLVKTLLINEAGGTADVTSMGAGFYIWLVSFTICVLGYLAAMIWSFIKPKNMAIVNP